MSKPSPNPPRLSAPLKCGDLSPLSAGDLSPSNTAARPNSPGRGRAFVVAFLVGVFPCGAAQSPAPDGLALFEAKIRPLFLEHCEQCHGEKKTESGLRLDTKTGWQKGGEHGAVIVPGEPEQSRLIQAVRRAEDCAPYQREEHWPP